MTASRCPTVNDHCVKLVMVFSWVQAMSFDMQRGRYLNFRIVFGEIVIEPFQSEHEHKGRILHVELSHCFLRFACLTSEVIIFSQIFRHEESVDYATAFLELWIHQTFLVYLCLGNLTNRQIYLFIKGFCQGNSNLQTEIDTPAHLLTVQTLQSTRKVKPKCFLCNCVLPSLYKLLFIFTHPKFLTVNQTVEKHSKQFLSILLIHVFVYSFTSTHPTENSLGIEVFLSIFQKFLEEEVDLPHFSKLGLGIHCEITIKSMQSLSSVKTLQRGIEETSITQIFESKYLQMQFVFDQLLLFLCDLMLGLSLSLLLFNLFYYFLLLYFLHFFLNLYWHQRFFLQSFMQFLSQFDHFLMKICNFIDFGVTRLHFLLALQCVSETLLASEAIYSAILCAIDERMLSTVTVLIGAFQFLEIEASSLTTRKTYIQIGVVMSFISGATQGTFGDQIGNFLLLQIQRMLAQFRHFNNKQRILTIIPNKIITNITPNKQQTSYLIYFFYALRCYLSNSCRHSASIGPKQWHRIYCCIYLHSLIMSDRQSRKELSKELANYKPSRYSKAYSLYQRRTLPKVDPALRAIAFHSPLAPRLPVYKTLRAAARMLLLNEIELTLVATLIQESRWNIYGTLFFENEQSVGQLVCFPCENNDYRKLTLYVLLVGWAAKSAFNEDCEDMLHEVRRVCFNFKSIFQQWVPPFANLFSLCPAALNRIYSLHNSNNSVTRPDYQLLVDNIIKLSQAYSLEKDTPVSLPQSPVRRQLLGTSSRTKTSCPISRFTPVQLFGVKEAVVKDQSEINVFGNRDLSQSIPFPGIFGSSMVGIFGMGSVQVSKRSQMEYYQIELGQGDNNFMVFQGDPTLSSVLGFHRAVSNTEHFLQQEEAHSEC